MQSKMTALTKVLFMTDHILLNECLQDTMLTKYSCIIIDEAHERSIHTDLLLGMIKDALNNRPDLKVVITSATIDPDIFVDYFGGLDLCPVLRVSGRTFPVEVFWEQDNDVDSSFPDDYEKKALNKAIEIHQNEREGDILVFLTSAAETDRCKERIIRMVGDKEVQCLQLHGKLKPEEQQLVFANTPRGKRKIVFATNSAETSITIPGIKYVVDTGVVKEMRFDPKKNMNSLDVVQVSQSSADQRKGRAGRTSSGVCYRLYTHKIYRSFKKASSPEILRIQVSQALLKLMELGVDPMSFDYVQSPSPMAMKSALGELEEIGAVDTKGISELGRWIAKLPVEPRLGALIKKGMDMDITLETLIVASCCNQSGIFFRMGTPEEKKEADAKKMKFCHLGGDLLTMLNVYREWDKIQEKAKGKWCQTNSINGKAMKGVRDMMNEMVSVIKKDLDLKIKHEFKSPQDSDACVQNLIFECMTSKLAYYLGHESAGYLIVDRHQRVQLHPSSAILSLAFQPGWVVFNRVLKTSADFMTEVTPLSDDVVKDAIIKGKINVDMKLLENMKVKRVLKAPVGRHVFWKFVGPMHKNRRQVEEDISFACNGSLIVIEANKQRGEISLFSTNEYAKRASSMLRSILDEAPQQLLNESREEPIGHDRSCIRAVLREGGSAVDILMSDDYRAVNIKQKDNVMFDINEESIQTLLEDYGPVEQIWQTTGKRQQQSPFWGKATFTHKCDAKYAVEEINEDENCEFRLLPIIYDSQISAPKQGYTMKLTWCRRLGKGHCFVALNRPEDMTQILTNAPMINGTYVQVMISKQQSDLYIKGLARDATEDEVRDGLGSALGLSSYECRNRFRIIIPRLNVPIDNNEKDQIQNELASIISMYADRDSFRLHVRDFKQQTVTCVAFVTFMNPQICYDTANAMIDDDVEIREHCIDVQLECKTTVHVNKKLHAFVGEDLTSLVDRYVRKKSSTTLNIRHLKSGNFSVDINAVSPQKLAKAKVKVENVVGGDTFECGEKENLQFFFNKNGRDEARRIEKLTRTLIFVDERQMKISIQGLVRNRLRAIQMIEDYLSVHTHAKETEVCLKGEENPPGLLKDLIIRYGLRLTGLKDETGISKVSFNLRFHELTLIGKEENIIKAQEQIKSVRADLSTRGNIRIEDADLPDCPICLCPVEESDMCRLEYCGHAYCKCCLASMIQNAVSDRELPVVCAAEDCNKALVIRDINTQIKIGNIKRNALLDSAVAALVMKKSEEYHYCITPDCGIVYRVTKIGEMFSCPVCRVRICTACHLPFHEGITCAMYKSAKQSGDSLVKWLRVDPSNRKLCPKCGLGIQKTGGCEHMECKCGAHICWKCMRYFSSSGSCYGHLSEAHNSFV
jgi:ATP-dependent RNA helicase DHX8/PRP22